MGHGLHICVTAQTVNFSGMSLTAALKVLGHSFPGKFSPTVLFPRLLLSWGSHTSPSHCFLCPFTRLPWAAPTHHIPTKSQDSLSFLEKQFLALYPQLGLGPISVNQKHKREPAKALTYHFPFTVIDFPTWLSAPTRLCQ